ncbi:MAG: hypothetical protein MK212_03075 [Saprospiraceae bacterium]|nr:hypothetical protein [Saprospiraceae bacterium]
MFHSFTFITVLLLSLSACSSESSKKSLEPEIATSEEQWPFQKIKCYIRYVEDAKLIQSEIMFVDADGQAVGIEGGVLFNDKQMRSTTIPKVGIRYQGVVKRGVAHGTYRLTFTDVNNKDVLHEFDFPQFDSLSFPGNGLSKGNGGSFVWKGEPCAQNDVLLVRLTDATGITYKYNHMTGTRSTQYDIIPPSLKAVEKGKATLAATFRRKATIPTKNYSIELTMEHYSKEYDLVVGD